MIQGQFDAAARLGGSKSDAAKVGDVERPRKRRRMSPSPMGDSIEVKDGMESGTVPIKGESMGDLDHNESKMPGEGGCIKADYQKASEGEPCLKAANGKNNAVDTDVGPIEVDPDPDPRDEEVVLLSEESVLAGEWRGNSDSGFPSLQLEAQCKPDGGYDPSSAAMVIRKEQDQRQGPQQDRRSASPGPGQGPLKDPATSSPTRQAQSSPHPQHPLTASRHQHQHQHRKFRISKSLIPSSDPSLKTVLSSGPSTPKQSSSESGAQTTTLSSPLSSPPPIMSDPYEEQLTNSHSSSSRCTSPDSSDDTCPSSRRSFNYTQAIKQATLSTLKGRDLFDASIWSDPLKTSVFYTFATNLRQKSRYASPSGSHHFITHLRNTGKMVRCYTQNIDLLEDKVGLATRLLLGTGSRSRFSARNARAAAAASSRQDPVGNDGPPAELGPIGRLTIPGGVSRPVLAEGTNSAEAATPNRQVVTSGIVDEASAMHQGLCGNDRGQAEEAGQDGADRGQDCSGNGKLPIGANSDNVTQVQGGGAGAAPRSDPSSPEPDRGVECVYLHGSLRALRCFQCGGVVDWDEGDRELQTMSGQQPPCPRCEDATAARQERGKRALGVGKLRPDIVLYGEEHPESQQISDIIQHDLSLAPDMLIIMGTSLKVHGLKTVVKEFAKAVHNKKDGKVIFINYTKPADSVWADTIDFWVQMDCDAWVHDLKEKKPLIWLPPGSIAEESRNKRRRRTNNDGEKTAKESIKTENSDGTTTLVLGNKSNKPQKREAPKATKPPESNPQPKPQPKRPAAFRDHKANGAFLTTKIIRDLAAISGRDVPKYSSVSIAAKETPRVGAPVRAPVSTAERPCASKQTLKRGRGPRLKNARTRNPGSKVATSTRAVAASDSIEESTKPGADQIKVEASTKKHHTSQVVPGPISTVTHAPLPLLTEETKPRSDTRDVDSAASMKQKASLPTNAQDQAILAEMPVPNSSPDPVVNDNSIVAAVKSHHRIRKPKAFFESKPPPPKSGRGTKKAKLSGKAIKADQGRQTPQRQTPVLPPPRPNPRPTTSTSARRSTTSSQQSDVPGESYTLPPLHIQNLEGYKYPTQYGEQRYPPAQPPAYLEPTVFVEGPTSEMSPTTSPQHWRNRAASLKDPQSRQFEGPCRGLDFMDTPLAAPSAEPATMIGVPPTLAPPPAQLAAQLAKINAAPPPASRAVLMNAPFLAPPQAGTVDTQPPPGVQSVEDSPNRQLQRENEAAAALSQLRSPPVFDDRRFAMI